MTDARFPERWLNDRRVRRLSDPAFRLFVISLAWSVSNRTDGVLYPDDLALLADVDPARAAEIEKSGLWEREKDYWLITEFEDTQTTNAVLIAMDHQRRHEREKKARQRAHSRGDHVLCRPDTCQFVRSPVPGDVAGDTKDRTGQDRRSYGDQADDDDPWKESA